MPRQEEVVQKAKTPWYKFNGSGLSGYSLEIKSNEDAYKTIIDTAWGFIFVGVLAVALSFLVPNAWLDGLFYITVGALLGYQKKTWTGWLAIVIGVLTVINTLYNGLTGSGGHNIYLAAVILFLSIKSHKAIQFLTINQASITPTTKLQKVGEKIFPFLFWVLLVVDISILILIMLGLFAGGGSAS